jgi:hypothetical protein
MYTYALNLNPPLLVYLVNSWLPLRTSRCGKNINVLVFVIDWFELKRFIMDKLIWRRSTVQVTKHTGRRCLTSTNHALLPRRPWRKSVGPIMRKRGDPLALEISKTFYFDTVAQHFGSTANPFYQQATGSLPGISPKHIAGCQKTRFPTIILKQFRGFLLITSLASSNKLIKCSRTIFLTGSHPIFRQYPAKTRCIRQILAVKNSVQTPV